MNISAAVLREVGGPFTIETLVLDEPRPDEVIVRLTSTGICRTDIGFQQGFLPVPVPGGHGVTPSVTYGSRP